VLRCFFLLSTIGFIRCDGGKAVHKAGDETILFRTSQYNLVFRLTIDDDFTYYDPLLNREIVFGYPIGKYKKKKDSSIIHLRINDKDTIFKYALFEVDSILLGLSGNRDFYIITNHNKDAWVID
jgi:hypothetical protein